MNVVQKNQWDITDIYESDINGGNPDQDVLYIMTYLGEGEDVEIKHPDDVEISPDLQEELEAMDGYEGNELVFIATASRTNNPGNVRINPTAYWKEKRFGDGKFAILVLEDGTAAGRPRKKKRTSNAVTDIKPNRQKH